MRTFAEIPGRLLLAAAGLVAAPLPAAERPQLLDHLTGSLELRADAYPKAPTPRPELSDRDRSACEAALKWQSWMRLDRLRLDVGGWFEAGHRYSHRWEQGMDGFQDRETRSRSVEFDRLMLTWAGGDDGEWEVAAGKGVFRNSLAVLATLADRHTLSSDANDPLNHKRLGVWQLRLDRLAAGGQFTVAALPVFQPAKIPSSESRWFLDEADFMQPYLLPGMTARVEDDIPGCHFPELGWFARYAAKSATLDWFVQGYRGPSDDPAYRLERVTAQEVLLARRYVPCWEAAAGLATSHGPWELHGESVYHRPDAARDDEFVTTVIGSTRRLPGAADLLHWDDLAFTVEYLGEWVVEPFVPDREFVAGSDRLRPASAILAELTVTVDMNRSAKLQSVNDLDGEDFHLVGLEVSQKIRDNLRISAQAAVLSGRDSRLRPWRRNDRLRVTLTCDF